MVYGLWGTLLATPIVGVTVFYILLQIKCPRSMIEDESLSIMHAHLKSYLTFW